jgi:two-component system phosphate regulon sensor histidine kinase PhoR
MIKFLRRNRTFRLRAVRAYLLTILTCTLLLFCFSIISLNEQEMRTGREIWYIGLAAVMLLCAMGLGLTMFIRVSWDLRWFQLRADFVSGVSHEFKTPLSLIRLYSETLAAADQEFSAEDRSNYIRIIARESERMSRMVDNVLSFARLEQGRNRYELDEGDIAATVTQTVNDYSEYLNWRGFAVKTSIWPELPSVRFNAEQLSEMLLNLMDNARKYSGKSRQIRVNVWAQNQEVIVEVRDDGLGIPADEREKIFQPFYRIARENDQGGCGLGLYLVDQVMKDHDGRVEVESQVNHGSRFRLVFPVAGHKQARAAKKKSHELTDAQFERQVQN